MTQVKIPNAVAHMTPSGSRVLTDRETRSMQVEGWDRNKHLEYYSVPLISVVDATAYADARVKEALEEAAEIADRHNAFATYDEIRASIKEQQK